MTWKVCDEARKNIEDENGKSFLCYNQDVAKELSTYLNKKEEEQRIVTVPFDEELDLHSDFIEWDNLNYWLSKTTRRLTEIEEIYQEEFKIELAQAMEEKVDFKKIYGGNTEKTRKQYVDEQLSDLIAEKKELKALQSDDLRRIEFLKRLIQMKLKVIGMDKGVELK